METHPKQHLLRVALQLLCHAQPHHARVLSVARVAGLCGRLSFRQHVDFKGGDFVVLLYGCVYN